MSYNKYNKRSNNYYSVLRSLLYIVIIVATLAGAYHKGYFNDISNSIQKSNKSYSNSYSASSDKNIGNGKVEDQRYNRSWPSTPTYYKVTDVNGKTCNSTLRYKLMREQSTDFTFQRNSCKVAKATVYDKYDGKNFVITSSTGEKTMELDHLVPYHMLWEILGKYYQADNKHELANKLYYKSDNMVLTSFANNRDKSDDVIDGSSCKYYKDGTQCEVWNKNVPQSVKNQYNQVIREVIVERDAYLKNRK